MVVPVGGLMPPTGTPLCGGLLWITARNNPMKPVLDCLIIITPTPLFAFADGGIFIEQKPGGYMQETRQRAAIFYENDYD